MSTSGQAGKPVNEYRNGSAENLPPSLQVHLTDENAQMLLERMKTFDQDSENASDWSDVKSRILQEKPLA